MHNLSISVESLLEGCIICSVAHAVWVRQYPFAKWWQYWDGAHYQLNDMEGNLVTITKSKNALIGAISRKNLFIDQSNKSLKNALKKALEQMPKDLRQLAESETIQYLIQEKDGEELPVITNFFWSKDGQLYSTKERQNWYEIWSTVIEKQLMKGEDTLEACKDDYSLSDAELDLVRILSKEKIQARFERIEIKLRPEMMSLLRIGSSQDTLDLLQKMGISIINFY